MDTRSEEYSKNLQKRYHRGRSFYLFSFIYPKYVKELTKGSVWDLGCGIGEFLAFCRKRRISAFGIDSNPFFVGECQEKGLAVHLGDIVDIESLPSMENAVCDNVLEHLSLEQIRLLLLGLKRKLNQGGVLLIIVPGRRGYLKDPTHRTFVDRELMEGLCREVGLDLEKVFYYPVPGRFLGSFFYLNMTILKIRL